MKTLYDIHIMSLVYMAACMHEDKVDYELKTGINDFTESFEEVSTWACYLGDLIPIINRGEAPNNSVSFTKHVCGTPVDKHFDNVQFIHVYKQQFDYVIKIEQSDGFVVTTNLNDITNMVISDV